MSPKAGSFAVSFVLYKMLIPVRLAITIAIIPTVFKKFDIKIKTEENDLIQNEKVIQNNEINQSKASS